MKLRTFLAKDMREALASVRAEMGPEAVIVASERAKGGGIVVRAALDEPEVVQPEPANDYSDDTVSEPAGFDAGYRENLIRRLRAPSDRPGHRTRNFNRAELLALLRGHRAADTLAHELAEAAEKSGLSDMTLALASALDKGMRAKPLDVADCSALLLCGPPGAGKTATAAKIAAHAGLIGRPVRLIAADASGAGAVARLETFAKHLGAELVVAESAALLEKHVSDANAQDVLAIIDTAGFDPRHAKSRTAFSALAHIEGLETIAILPATMDAEESAEIARALLTLGATRMIVTCLDLVRRAGTVLTAAVQGAPLAHVSRSPFVAGGLETLTPLSLARLLIESERADAGSPQ
ncbi:MAG: AAA family ATPase [Rhizomicrobium sp.]|jgi:flagellar biosynthesis protein FlhF